MRVGFDKLDTLIHKNDALPTEPVTRPYRPGNPESTEVEVALYQYDESVVSRTPDGELPVIKGDFTSKPQQVSEIGSVRIDKLTGENRSIDVTFKMDSNRVLNVVVKRQSDGVEFPLSITRTR